MSTVHTPFSGFLVLRCLHKAQLDVDGNDLQPDASALDGCPNLYWLAKVVRMYAKIIRQRLFGKEFRQRFGCVPLSQTQKRTAIEGHIGNLHAALYQVGGIFFLWISEEPHFLFGCKTIQARLSMELLSSS